MPSTDPDNDSIDPPKADPLKSKGLFMRHHLLVICVCVLTPSCLDADLAVPSFFSDHMVLQREGKAQIWGTADPGHAVTVAFKGHSVSTKADTNGRWQVSIPTGKADANGAKLTIQSDQSTIELNDVLVGEVWFASGQSNMAFTMNRIPTYKELVAESNHPAIRMFNAPLVTSVEPLDDIEGQWTLCNPQTVPNYSAVAFFFARKLHQELNIPIGVIKSAWGGKPVETFTSRAALRTLPGTKKLVETAETEDANFDRKKAMAQHEVRLQQWQDAVAKWSKEPADNRGRRPRRPATPKRALDTEGRPGVLFNSMIHPFIGYTLRGAIWYQGEGNAKVGAVPYDQTLPLMINDWRSRWKDDFSFYFVQLANFRQPTTEPGDKSPWPLLQDRMRRVLDSTPKTGMAITNDIGEADDIHPKNKLDVGERLALWALAKDYKQDLVYCGPLYQSSRVNGDRIEVTFKSVGDGLKSRDGGDLKRFEIAGKENDWHWAEAKIASNNTVEVSSDQVPKPAAVRYAWAANPQGANLVNSEGLPASVFRTDNWGDVEDSAALEAQKVSLQRRELGAKIKAIAAQKAALKRNSDQYKRLHVEHQTLMKKFRSMTPK